eukprot:SAG31_NODE_2546_length_5531_cov_1.748159_2_plen_40_part_00
MKCEFIDWPEVGRKAVHLTDSENDQGLEFALLGAQSKSY